ncbi:RNA polymerase sigma factor [Pseudobacteroides cellulosolvens]|uniref:RNA polymerase, sigma-24 subunit, RpoE, ECF subfamily n=1 Tax=Pseudobacteroides cellulosolvens ATCC 35603 = DSM 2933 TaxID=398512 RepID=A0A0L6JST4_9FIRM|nr:RNA polymerase sigma factor [Pseudobacteroides cellulosolvens]KNY28749.1 RNA polymerase, sigma-24 subunit, RpoE, ECF subfamily [Pseudobacteroides cellulosolvens ATCC 35603 = DSM 2933]
MDEIGLVIKCQQGDMEAYEALFGSYFNKAVRYAFLITGRNDLAEDIVQEALIECYKDIKSLKSPEKFKSWFYRILVRTSWRVKSKEKGKVSIEEFDGCDYKSINENLNDDFERLVERRESSRLIKDALHKLSLPLRTTVVLHYYNDLSIKEIAQVLKCFQGTVKSRLHNARKILHKELVKEGYVCDGKECGTNA